FHKPALISWLQESEAPFPPDPKDEERLAGHRKEDENYSEQCEKSIKMTSHEGEEKPSRNPEQSKRQKESKAEKSGNQSVVEKHQSRVPGRLLFWGGVETLKMQPAR
ncbi:UNVERIFIED_CONTAM: hypothetical protein K2H54_063360, partial [Gekko kuhli]